MNEELKPCPFCGEQPEVIKTEGRYVEYIVSCTNIFNEDGSGCPVEPCCTTYFYEESKAIAAWNTRVDLQRQALVESIERRLWLRMNDHLLGMEPDFDDSIVGFNQAQDIMRELFADIRNEATK